MKNSRFKDHSKRILTPLTMSELQEAENYWIKIIQAAHFKTEIEHILSKQPLSKSNSLLTLNPIVDNYNLLRVGGRRQLSTTPYHSKHPLIIHAKHKLTHLIIHSEHLRLLHAGPTILIASLNRRYHIVGGSKTVRSIVRKCVVCRKLSAKPHPQMLGQLPIERVTPGSVFEKVGIDYAGPVSIKYGHVRKPTIVKAYICVFVSLSVKAELVTDLTSDAFIACLRRFIARRGLPNLIWSDNGTNFVGACRQLRELSEYLKTKAVQDSISKFLTSQNVEWKFIPQHAPHFGGLWEAAVKSTKTHLRKILGEVKLTYEKMSTVLSQIEACLNSRPLVPLNNEDDGIEALTPGHFLIGQPLKALPDTSLIMTQKMSLLKRWHLCQSLLRHFWRRWSREYLVHMGRFHKWKHPTRNLHIGDMVVIKEDSPLLNEWPLARVIEVHPGHNGLVRVATIKTSNGVYKRPINKLALLLSSEEQQY
ncbi:uncharacterized protein LOC135351065 [Halichondria panicea]|uniref:uncharacterized protein LOC135351065 n=1 Tax=Halichondria panicea TaxID=6063 RepID=UPI00312B45C0